jgi:NitT/TauT family transport system permease protein
MSVGSSQHSSEIVRPNDWQAPPSSSGFAPVAATGSSRRMRVARRIAWNLLPPLTFVAIVGLWWAAVEVFRIPAYLLPGPRGVFARLVTDASVLWTHSKVTLTEILLGFGLTVVTAIPLGLVIALSPLAKQLVYPPLMLMQLVPKIAVAPLFLVWLGFGMESKVLLTVLMTFFPLLLASISGFQILDDRLLYLTQSMGATRWQTFRYLRFPAALPVIFSGIKT